MAEYISSKFTFSELNVVQSRLCYPQASTGR